MLLNMMTVTDVRRGQLLQWMTCKMLILFAGVGVMAKSFTSVFSITNVFMFLEGEDDAL